MKTIASKELQRNLDDVLNSSQKERIIISRQGRPCAVLIGIQDYDEEDLQLAASPEFWLMIQQRRSQGKAIPLAEVEARLKTRSGKPAGRGTRKNTGAS